MEGTLAAQVLAGLKLDASNLRKSIAETQNPAVLEAKTETEEEASSILNGFLATLEAQRWVESARFLATDAQFIDWAGKRWQGRVEIEKQFAELFVPYAKRDTSFRMESVACGPAFCAVASVLWENVTVPGANAKATHRMMMVLVQEDREWAILLLQITPVVIA